MFPLIRRTPIKAKTYEYKGQLLTLKELAKLSPAGRTSTTMAANLKAGWSVEQCVETPRGHRVKAGKRWLVHRRDEYWEVDDLTQWCHAYNEDPIDVRNLASLIRRGKTPGGLSWRAWAEVID
jgi:hypothetical protein